MQDDDPRDANGFRYAEYPARRAYGKQKVRNMSWPQHKDGIGQAVGRQYDDKPYEQQIDVQVRADFTDDGEQWLDGRAIRWHGDHVCVLVRDDRLASPYLWVRARDVRRR